MRKKWVEMDFSEKHQVVGAAESYGGSFMSRIAKAWFVADSGNREKLEIAFGQDFSKFQDFVKRDDA